MITCGVDIGSVSIEIVLLENGKHLSAAQAACGAFPAANAEKLFKSLIEHTRISRSDIKRIVATGFGRNYFVEADKVISEISCHAAGVLSIYPMARSIIEIGGQDSKVICIGRNGRVADFAMNDRCAAGTGKFIESVARTLCMSLEETGPAGQNGTDVCEISSMCAVFAETEIVGLLHQGVSRNAVLRGVFKSVARRVIGMAARFTLHDQLVFTGGGARNTGILDFLKELTGREIAVPAAPQFTGAIGAALLALNENVISPAIQPAVTQDVQCHIDPYPIECYATQTAA